VTDNRQWQAPEGASAPTPPPGYAANGPTTGWTPPPRPGLIPLRPLDLGTILGASFRVLRRNPRPTFGSALLIEGVASIVSVAVVGIVSYLAFSRIAFSDDADRAIISNGSYGILVLAALVPVLLSIISSALLEGIIVLEVARGTLGEKQRLGGLWARARGRIWALIGWTALVTVAVILIIGTLVGLVVLLVATMGVAGIVIGVLVGLVGGLGLLVIYLWLDTKLAFVPSALMVERLGIRRAVARSWSLTRGYFWRTLGIRLLVTVILQIASQIVSTPVSFIGLLLIGLTDPNGQNGPTTMALTFGLIAVSLIIGIVVGAITAVVQSASTALLYLDLRMRKEGLDLELARFVEARQSGDDVTDPYLPVATDT
jgi:hypothetical protein